MPDDLLDNSDFMRMEGGLPAGWRTRTPREEVSPKFSLGRDPVTKAPALRTEFPRGERTFGWWECVSAELVPGRHYTASVEVAWSAIDAPRETVALQLAWIDGPDGREVRKEIVSPVREAEDFWHRLEITGVCPEGARHARVELVSRWSREGKVLWLSPELVEVGAPPARRITLAAVACRGSDDPDENRRRHIEQARAAAEAGADLVLLTEAFPRTGTGLGALEAAEPLRGPSFEAAAKLASEAGVFIAGGIDERAGDALYNTMILVGPDGDLAGAYRKTHLPETERLAGVTPGTEYPVFETSICRIGMEVCYDNFFPEVARSLAVRGAEVILCSIAGDGREGGVNWEVVSRARAIDNGVAFAAAIRPPARCLIIDQWGHVLADSEGEEGFIKAEVDLDARRPKRWLSVASEGEWRGLWPHERRPGTYGDLT